MVLESLAVPGLSKKRELPEYNFELADFNILAADEKTRLAFV